MNDERPVEFRLYQNEPNPCAGKTTIRFAVPVTSHVRITLYDREHKLVAVLFDEVVTAGYHTIIWNGLSAEGSLLTHGFYTYRLEASGFVATRKLEIKKENLKK